MPVHVHVPVHAYLTVARATRELRVCREENTSIVWMQRRRKEEEEGEEGERKDDPGRGPGSRVQPLLQQQKLCRLHRLQTHSATTINTQTHYSCLFIQ